jgi:ATP-binding cassette subfamily F protein 3
MRVLLAKMLLEEPGVLLLDEPTNHLDLPSIQWLENYLKGFGGITIIVSHDRFFIDRMADKILEISLKKLNEYAGNYSYYLEEKAIRHEQQQRSYENQQKYIEQQERFITRFKAKATKAKQAQSKLKQLEKIDRIEAPEEEGFGFNLRFQLSQKSGKEVIRLRHINKAYGSKEILQNSDGTILKGDKIALIGANGLGKSTLLRIVAGTESHQGACETGHNVIPAFFAQHQLESLDIKANILEEIAKAGAGFTETELRGILGCFMFSGDEVEKKIKVLSGGERSRVAMAKTLISHANFLLLDEPTNHLDIPSIQVLIQALNAYEGTYIIVSHDRWFLQQVANKIWFIEEKKLKEYPGTYEEYEHWKAKREAEGEAGGEARGEKREARQDKREARGGTEEKKQVLDYKERKQIQNKIKKLKRDIEEFEEKIEALEAEKEAVIMKLATPEVASDYTKLSEAQAEMAKLDEEILDFTAQWEEALEALEEMGED